MNKLLWQQFGAAIDMLAFLEEGRAKLHRQLSGTDDLLTKRFVSEYKDYSLFELLLYNMRHVQHHAAQLNLLLRQAGQTPPDWVSRTKKSFSPLS
ncbi:DinB family protein [Dinghuibacter silviterrae]|uniref:DinB family protein n=1 Tax=Dinghuibacter silviterrae TaxID=1539049 RepID=UPI001062DFEC|nr:DinB family protein [Dinghuibacter silviterrae]